MSRIRNPRVSFFAGDMLAINGELPDRAIRCVHYDLVVISAGQSGMLKLARDGGARERDLRSIAHRIGVDVRALKHAIQVLTGLGIITQSSTHISTMLLSDRPTDRTQHRRDIGADIAATSTPILKNSSTISKACEVLGMATEQEGNTLCHIDGVEGVLHTPPPSALGVSHRQLRPARAPSDDEFEVGARAREAAEAREWEAARQ